MGNRLVDRVDQRKKGANKEQAKIRVLLVEKMLRYDHRITTKEIQNALDLKYDMQVTRKTLRSDLNAISRVVPLDVTKGYGGGYKKWSVPED